MSRTPCSMHGPRPCQPFHAGHHIHPIHARHVGETPWGWRDGVVTAVHGSDVTVQYLETDHVLRVWHHRPLPVVVGDPVRVHERYYVVSGSWGWASVVVTGGLGAVPEPAAAELWRPERSVPVVDLSTGHGLPEEPQ